LLIVGTALVLVAVALVVVVLGLLFFIERGDVPRIGLPASWKAFAKQNQGHHGDGHVRFRFAGGRVSMYHSTFRAKDSERMHGLKPGDYTVLARTLERKEPEFRADAALDLSELPPGTHGMISGPIARVCLPGMVEDFRTLERALSALGALHQEG
jgi:hypothetical protein